MRTQTYDTVPQATAVPEPRRPRLPFVDGSRGLASLWIVCQHFLPHSTDGPLVKSLWRSNAAVCYFIVLSGFVTHWAARGTFASSASRLSDAKRWYGRRFGRVLLAVWLAMGVSTLLLHAGGHGDLGAAHLARCALLVEPWRSPNRWCPDGQSWTVAALAPSWLAYPVFYDPFLYERSHLIIVALALAILPSCVALLFLSGRLDAGAYFNHSPHTALYLWPPAQMPDFLLGCVSAELAARSTRTRTAHMADGAFLLIALAVLVVPNPALDYRAHAEILFDHGLAPLFALFLWAAARDASNGSKAARVFAHATLASLGTCSFEVYLFQWPVHTIFVGLGLPTTAAENFVAFALVLYALAALYEHYVERPYVRWLRRRFAAPPRSASQASLAAF